MGMVIVEGCLNFRDYGGDQLAFVKNFGQTAANFLGGFQRPGPAGEPLQGFAELCGHRIEAFGQTRNFLRALHRGL